MRVKLFNLFFAFVYSILMFVLTGIPDLASAAMSCNDLIPGTSYRYIDSLAKFFSLNGKTYAISKTAITGVTDLPDGFFNFDSFITREYKLDGNPYGSLFQRLATGEYGAARPVKITSAEIGRASCRERV